MFTIPILIRNFILTLVLGWASYTDIKRQEIDFEPLIVGIIFAIPFNLLGFNDVTFWNALLGMVVSFAIFFIFSFFGMGGGDMKLIAIVGLFLGFSNVLLSMVLSFYVGATLAIFILIFKKGKNKLKTKVPFGPSITMATIITMLYGPQILNWFFGLFRFEVTMS